MGAQSETLRPTADMAEYAEWVSEPGFDAPWSRPGPLIAVKRTSVDPFIWHWRDLEPRLERSPEFMIPGEGGERRILRLANPGVPEMTTAHTISLAVQYLLPGETAPAHRHTPNALRFMLQGSGAYTVVEGQKCNMKRGDLVLTPHMTVHEHGNEGDDPVIWIDILDSPIVRYLEALRMESDEDIEDASDPAGPPRMIFFQWDDAHAELEKRAQAGDTDPFDDVVYEYADPQGNAASIYPTLACYLQMLRPGVETQAHTQNSTAAYHVVSGAGSTTVGDDRYEWEQGDFFVVPPNVPHNHKNADSEPAVLFSAHDKPLLEALGLYRES